MDMLELNKFKENKLFLSSSIFGMFSARFLLLEMKTELRWGSLILKN